MLYLHFARATEAQKVSKRCNTNQNHSVDMILVHFWNGPPAMIRTDYTYSATLASLGSARAFAGGFSMDDPIAVIRYYSF
jgi:hypothetical protein